MTNSYKKGLGLNEGVCIRLQREAVRDLTAVVNCSEQLRDAHKVCLLQIFEAWECFVEILRQVENFL